MAACERSPCGVKCRGPSRKKRENEEKEGKMEEEDVENRNQVISIPVGNRKREMGEIST